MSRTDKAPTPAPAAAPGTSGAPAGRKPRCGFPAPRAGPAAADRLPG